MYIGKYFFSSFFFHVSRYLEKGINVKILKMQSIIWHGKTQSQICFWGNVVTNVNVCSHHSFLDLMEMFTCLSIHTLLNLIPSAAPEEEAVLLLFSSMEWVCKKERKKIKFFFYIIFFSFFSFLLFGYFVCVF